MPMRPLRIVLATLALVLLAGVSAWLWYQRYHPDRHRYPLRGVDVSHHQGAIDWPAVAHGDVAFAYIKASEGADNRDPAFLDNWRRARAAGLAVGAYHYFTLCRSGGAQARNFLAAVPHEADALPPVVDLEFGGNCGLRPDGPTFRAQLTAFLAPVEAREGKAAIFYLTPEFLAAYGDSLPSRPIWRRSIALEPGDDAPWIYWQFHNRGHATGVAGPVDLNVFNGNRAALQRLTRSNPPAKP